MCVCVCDFHAGCQVSTGESSQGKCLFVCLRVCECVKNIGIDFQGMWTDSATDYLVAYINIDDLNLEVRFRSF